MNELIIRNAIVTDAYNLSKVAYESKSFWKYPEEYMDIWKSELTITAEYIEKNIIRCVIVSDRIIGFYSIVYMPEPKWFGKVFVENGYWLDHMFIIPEYHNKGIGTQLFKDINELGLSEKTIKIFVDPYATGFYDKQGAKKIRISESSIKNRKIPVFEYELK